MITYEKNSDTIKKITTTEESFDLKKLRLEISEIDNQLKDLEAQPDEMIMPNDFKFQQLSYLKIRKEELNKILSIK